jgi:uncharacterized protein YqhQ
VTRIVLLPVIAGIAYELIRFACQHQDNQILTCCWRRACGRSGHHARAVVDQIEVSIRALKEVLLLEINDPMSAK